MIHWLTQSTDAHPALAQGIPPAGLLNAAEQSQFAALKTEKRRRDWLLGRWTAKRLIQQVAAQQIDQTPALNEIEIANTPAGVPIVNSQSAVSNPLSLSISHSHSHAFCAVWEQADWAIGADMEQIAPRSDTFVYDYFTAGEIDCFENWQLSIVNRQLPTGDGSRNTAQGTRDTWVTAVWSAKEAALKALHVGLSVDTRAVSCLIQPEAIPPQAWTPFGMALDGQRLGSPLPFLTGWWRVLDGFVLTLVVEQR